MGDRDADEVDRAPDDLVRFAALVELSADFIAMALPDGTVAYVNAAGRELVGVGSLEEAVARSTDDYFSEVGRELSHEIEAAVRTRGHWEGESHLRHFPTGEAIPVSVNSFLVTHPQTGEPLALATVQRDLRPQKAIERRLRAGAERLERSDAEQRAIAHLGLVALDATLTELLHAVAEQVASTIGEVSVTVHQVREGGGLWLALASSDGEIPTATTPHDVALRAWQADASVVESSEMAVPVPSAERPWGVICVAGGRDDVTVSAERLPFLRAVSGVLSSALRRLAVEEALRHQVLHDPLTHLPNRLLAADRLERALERSARTGTATAVILVDLDDFKTVNDSLGHAAGDELLVAIADRLVGAVRVEDTVCRLGGDEFVVVCEDLDGEIDAIAVAERVRASWAEPIEVAGVSLHVVGSVGLTFVGGDSPREIAEAAEMLRQADMAMYRAKAKRLGGFEVFDERMRAAALRRLSIATALRRDVDAGGLSLVYQPIVDVRTGAVTAVEALARWHGPDDGIGAVGPAEFIEVAEQTGLIRGLGEWALTEACRTAAAWDGDAPPGIRVNVSPLQLSDPDFTGTVAQTLREAGLPASRLGLELTEAALVDDSEATRTTIQRLHELGVQLLLDDFGTGYSALSYLHRFPQIGCLKIDRSFVSGMRHRRSDEAIVTAVIALAREFGLEVVAEGVEEPAQLERLRELGCGMAQGYLLGRPMPVEDLRARLTGNEVHPPS